MDIKDILSKCDHTNLAVTAGWEDIKTTLDDAIKYGTASVCIPPSFVKRAKAYVKDGIKICTVVGFPNGYNTTDIKVAEAIDAIKAGADEVDMVINIGEAKAHNYQYVYDEIVKVKEACGDKICKVIVEACLLTDQEKAELAKIVTAAKADFIKTSTGFSQSGATIEDVEIFKKNVGKDVLIKAAGGISSIEAAQKFIDMGVARLGTSRIVKIVKEKE